MFRRVTNHLIATLLLCGLGLIALAQDAPKPVSVEGDWQGSISAGAIELRIVFHLKQSAAGELSGTMDSVDQGANGLPLSGASFKDGELKLELMLINGGFEGKLDASGQTAAGSWKQGPGSTPLTLKRLSEPFKLLRPQEPKKPYPYREEEVVFESPQGNSKLAGTLTLPEGKNLPAVVLISGSGAQDRDETLMGHKPFWVLADHLSRRGIAVLRYDDRGTAKSSGNFATATSVDFKNDALAAVEFLKSRPEIDGQRIGLCGHSEGGLIAPMAAVESPDVAFIVLMAGPGVTGEEILYLQGAELSKAGGASDKDVERATALQREMFAIIKAEPDSKLAREKFKAAFENRFSQEEQKEMKQAGVSIDSQFDRIDNPWFRYFLFYDPAPTIAKVTCPVLAINGEKDLQVVPSQNLPVLKKFLESGGNKDFTLTELPGLNHLFQTCQTGAVSEYGLIEETMSPAALEAIGTWIVAHTKSK